ncbi:protein LURP-one-related 15-like [Dioscorea cayenensis subsp. rotundata]|uniref:Protein LURP-one-related 15-like n=1 Tax=Dioscorea cayennensis subsp. rotundata TaxID=55577 RepID=A0AB40BX87_DIOCR|nr:protein LURP-one-related 15-like [Dioscorea cayenensis subsp. rotundata]
MDSEQHSRPIVAPQYCLARPTDLAFARKVDGVKHGKLSITDVNGNILFWFDASAWRSKRKLVDAATGIPILSITQKFWSAHDRWNVFMGDSTNEKDLLFTVKRSSVFQLRTDLEVFLATNTNKNECDFKVKGEFHKRSSVIYKGNTSVVVAQMNKEHKVVKVPLGKHAFGVSIVENMDIAFIAGLVVVLNEFYEYEMAAVAGGASGAGTSAALAASC